jgi:hypothetical protein
MPLSRNENEGSEDSGKNLFGKDIELVHLDKNYGAFTCGPIGGLREIDRPRVKAAEPILLNVRRKKSVRENIWSKGGDDPQGEEPKKYSVEPLTNPQLCDSLREAIRTLA